MFVTGVLFYIMLCIIAMVYLYDKIKVDESKLLKTPQQILAFILIPVISVLLALAWHGLKSLKPEKYEVLSDYWDGFVWHFF